MASSQFDWFVSDIHLSPGRPDLTEGFLAFLGNRHDDTRRLYILGDLFDYWIGDDVHLNVYRSVIGALQRLHQVGVSLYFCPGNRDFLVGDLFYDATGCQPLGEITSIQIADQKCLLLHGDTLCTDDAAYLQLRKQLRNPSWQASFLSQPPAERVRYAENLRAQSQQANAEKAEQILDANQQAIEDTLLLHQASLMIHGHTHRPNRHPWQLQGAFVERIVLGDWGAQGWALKSTEQSLELLNWPLKEPV